GVKLSGKKMFVSDAGVADVIICVARAGNDLLLAAVPAKATGVKIKPMSALDDTRKLYEVSFEDVTVSGDDVLAKGEAAAKALDKSLLVATTIASADMLGGMQWMLDDATEYSKTRQQFGKLTGSFQAVQHMLADMLLWTESSRSALYYAAWAIGSD